MSGNQFAAKCKGVASALKALAEQAKSAGDDVPQWEPNCEIETMSMLIDLAHDFTQIRVAKWFRSRSWVPTDVKPC